MVLADVFLVNLAVFLGLVIRFDANVPDIFVTYWLQALPLYSATAVLIFWALGLYSTIWRYASLREALGVVAGVTGATVVFAGLVLFAIPTGLGMPTRFPRTVVIIAWLLGCAFLGGYRFSVRLWQLLDVGQRRKSARRRLLIVGAGEAGAMVLREVQRQSRHEVEPVGFVDDDPAKQGLKIHGVPVVGTTADLATVVAAREVSEIVLAIPSAGRAAVNRIVRQCQHLPVKVRILPALSDLIHGRAAVARIREVQIEDLLGRDPVRVDMTSIARYLEGQTVLVTGAGGSIGSELCRQVARFNPAQLILLGHGENSIFEIALDLSFRHPALRFQPVIADVRDRRRMEQVFRGHRPAVVFHAAAHKHVYLMEAHPEEAVQTNVFGTQNVAECALEAGCARFVLVSTDKAVNPTGVMGATKRLAEMVVQDLNARGGPTRYCAVRFGNVLGSRGSVVQVFREQIARGGPVTVTHPQMRRYFMTIGEAVELIVQAGALENGGELFVLDMGEPVNILELAEQMIRLSGFEPGVDIPIRFTGPRPGEKLFEELFTSAEGLEATLHERIYVARQEPVDPEVLAGALDRLAQALEAGDPGAVREALRAVVPFTGVPAPALAEVAVATAHTSSAEDSPP